MAKIGQTLGKVRASEWIYLAGVVLLLTGLVLWMGLGIALTVVGGLLVATALLNGWMIWRAEVSDAV